MNATSIVDLQPGDWVKIEYQKMRRTVTPPGNTYSYLQVGLAEGKVWLGASTGEMYVATLPITGPGAVQFTVVEYRRRDQAISIDIQRPAARLSVQPPGSEFRRSAP